MGLGYRNAGEKGAMALGQLRQTWEPGPHALLGQPALENVTAGGSRPAAALVNTTLKGQGLSGLGLLAMPQTPGSATRGGPAWGV